MSSAKIAIGQFLSKRALSPDSPDDPYAPSGNLVSEKSFHEQDLKNNLTPDEPGQLYTPGPLPEMSAPALSMPSELPRQLAPPLPLPNPEVNQGLPQITLPNSIPFQPAPPLDVPGPEVTQTIPILGSPSPVAPGPLSRRNPPDHTAAPPTGPQDPILLSSPPADGPTRGGASQTHTPDEPFIPGQASGGPIGDIENRRFGKFSVSSDLDVQKRLHDFDANLQRSLREIDDTGRFAAYVGFPVNTPGDLLLDPTLYAKQLVRVAKDPLRLLMHSLTQVTLFAMNRRKRIWNPISVAPVPTTELFVPAGLDGFGVENDRDIHYELSKGVYSEEYLTSGIPPIVAIRNGGRGGLQALDHSVIGATSQDRSLVDNPEKELGKILTEESINQKNIYTDQRPYSTHVVGTTNTGELVETSLVERYTGKRNSLLDMSKNFAKLYSTYDREKPEFKLLPGSTNRPENNVLNTNLGRASHPEGIIPVKFSKDNSKGFVYTQNEKDSPIDDDSTLVPVSFTDMRSINDQYRTVYFRPFLTSLNESFSPEWNMQNYMGRVDPVATYQSTGRTISTGFKIVSFGPEDVVSIYQKLHWLTSMVYPEYDSNLMYSSGPAIRLRIGNVIDAKGPYNRRGLPGIITSLDFEYSDATWELQKDFKLPREVTVSLSFQVLHDMAIGRNEKGRFGGVGLYSGQEYHPTTDDVTMQLNGADTFRKFGESVDNPNHYELPHDPEGDARLTAEIEESQVEPHSSTSAKVKTATQLKRKKRSDTTGKNAGIENLPGFGGSERGTSVRQNDLARNEMYADMIKRGLKP